MQDRPPPSQAKNNKILSRKKSKAGTWKGFLHDSAWHDKGGIVGGTGLWQYLQHRISEIPQ